MLPRMRRLAGGRLRSTCLAAVAFAPFSFWNTPLPKSAPIDSNSRTYVTSLSRMLFTDGAWINTTSASEPVYTVPANQPTEAVKLYKTPTNPSATALQAAFEHVPIPPNAQPAAGHEKTRARVSGSETASAWSICPAASSSRRMRPPRIGRLVALAPQRLSSPL